LSLTGKIKPGLKIGIIQDLLTAEGMDKEISASIEEAVKVLEKLGASVKSVSMKTLDYVAAAYMVISRAEAASNLARFDGIKYGFRSPDSETLNDTYFNTRHDGFGMEVRTRIMVGNYVLSAGYAGKFYENAKKVQSQIRAEFKKLFGDIDLLIMPAHSAPAFKIGAFDLDKLQMELQDYFTCPVNLAGIPAISVPCGFTKKDNLPIGLQIIGPHLSEELIFQTAYAYEQFTDWYKIRPEGF
jgi:aspartyl-tRNA(Asn)/glutamyl-tRNA(Gln) amidotransferase subunit A